MAPNEPFASKTVLPFDGFFEEICLEFRNSIILGSFFMESGSKLFIFFSISLLGVIRFFFVLGLRVKMAQFLTSSQILKNICFFDASFCSGSACSDFP